MLRNALRRTKQAIYRLLPARRVALPEATTPPRPEPVGPGAVPDASVPAQWQRQWIERGYVVAQGLFSASEVQAHRAMVSEVRRGLDESKDEHGHGDRIGQLHQRHPELMRLAANAAIRSFLAWAFGDRPVLFGSLNFERGSQQDAHIDAIFFYTEPVYAMAGLWVALEDVHPDAGPLFYLPGSHRWPFIRGEHLWGGEPGLRERIEKARGLPAGHADRVALAGRLGQAWTRQLAAAEQASGTRRDHAVVRAGDAVIWHALLAHGGSKQSDPRRTRQSVVYHYIGEKARLYTFDQFFLHSREEIQSLAGQRNRRGDWEGLPYIDYGYYVSYKDGREIVHRI